MGACVFQGELISPLSFSFYFNDMPSHSHHVDLTIYADDTAIIATYHKRGFSSGTWSYTSNNSTVVERMEGSP